MTFLDLKMVTKPGGEGRTALITQVDPKPSNARNSLMGVLTCAKSSLKQETTDLERNLETCGRWQHVH